MDSSDEDVSPRKKARVLKKRRDEEDEATSRSRGRQVAKAQSPERKKKGRHSREESNPKPVIHVDAQYQESDDEGSGAATDMADDEDDASSRENENEENENARYRLDHDKEEDAFEIPSRDDDLLFHGKVGYRITEVMDTEQAMNAIEEFEEEIAQERWRCLYERFPAFFALVRQPSDGPRAEVPHVLRSRLVTSLILTYTHMSQSGSFRKYISKASRDQSKRTRNHCRDLADHVSMLVYLLYRLIVIFEDEARANKKKPKKAGGRGRKKGKGVMQNEDGDMMSGGDDEGMGETEDENSWEDNRMKVIECLMDIVNCTGVDPDGKTLETAMRYLWKDGEVNRKLRHTIFDCAVKFLYNPDIIKAPSRGLLTKIFQLLRAVSINFRMFKYVGSNLFFNLTKLDFYKESSATAYPFIATIKAVGVNNDTNKLLQEMLVYFNENPFSVSSSNAKPLCLFMSSIVEAHPVFTCNYISPFIRLLTDENASVRSTVLNVMTTLLTQDFLDPTMHLLSEKYKNVRERMFDHLLQHVRDVNANVRASAIKCLTSMAKSQKIPNEVIHEGLMKLIGHRISDDKVAVRKEAIRFATIFLENNPYGHDFDRRMNERKLKEYLIKRDSIRVDGADTKSIKEAERMWDAVKEILTDKVQETVDSDLMDMFDIPTVEERKKWYCEHQERTTERDHGEAASQEASQPNEKEYTMRWLYTILLSEDFDNMQLKKDQLYKAARLLTAMGLTDQLKNENCSKDDLKKCRSRTETTKALMKAGRFVYLQLASLIAGRNEQMILEKEQERERQKKIRKALSRDIQDMVMKLVFEREYAKCLEAGMTAVLQGEGGDLKLGIEFVIKCKEFNISGAEESVRKLCGLVWKSDEEGRAQILQAASSMFMSSNTSSRLRDAATCENILNLVKRMSDHERGSVEQVLALTTEFNPMPDGVTDLLWEQVDEDSIKTGKKVSPEKKARQVAAMKALCLLSRTDVQRNRKWLRRYQAIVKEGWPEMAAEALGCIANLATWNTKEDGKKGEKEKEKRAYRIPYADTLFKTVQRFMLTELCREEALTWNRSLRATLDIYFHICKDTQEAIAGLTSKLMWFLRRTSQALRYYDQQQNTNGAMTPRSQRNEPTIDPIFKGVVVEERSKYLNRLWSVLLERLCVLASELAVRQLVHADYVFVREFIKARQYIASQTEGARFPRRPLHEWEESSVVRRGIFDWGTGNAEDVECTGLTEDERIREMARKMIDLHLVDSHNSLLGRLLPIVVHSVRAKGSPRRVRFQAMNALAKIMLVSPHIAQYGARTFFAFLNNAESPVLRSNLTVVAADLTFRHPNLVENHAAALFNQLQDPDPCVRETCVLILNHLISNDLIKTHVIMSYALLGYVDTTESIVHLTKGLFHEWSKKEGIMNHVPSFITRIAADSQKVSIEKFRRIMNEFFPLIRERKDADVQALVVKLCKRIELAKNPACVVRNPDMPAYFSHCLRLLTLNTRGFHKLVDCFEQYAQYLGDSRVYEDICALVKEFQTAEKKNPNTDLSAEIAVFLTKLAEENSKKAMENSEDRQHERERAKEGAKSSYSSNGLTSSSGAARKVRSKKAIGASASTPARPTGGRTRKTKRKTIESSDDDDSDY